MQALDELDEEMETIHLYVVREQPKKPYTALPLFCAFLCLLGMVALTIYSAQHPYYEYKRLNVPVELLPLKVFTAQSAIIPTGVKTYPATTAHGILTITNGSIIGQAIPAGFTVQGVATDRAMSVPPGNANGYGYATVAAHALTNGKSGNLAALAINQVEGSSVYIRNLTAFSGGRDSYSVKFITPHDREVALVKSRDLFVASVTGLRYPCSEQVSGTVTVTWRCQFVRYSVPAYMHVIGVQLVGNRVIVSVFYIARSVPTHWVK